MSMRFKGGVISATAPTTTTSAATGSWTVTQQMQGIGQGIWPLPPVPLPAIGESYAGGFFAGQISTAGNGVADYNLVVGPKASCQSDLTWKTSNTTTAGTDSVINGPANSAAMDNANHPAAQFCESRTVGGFTDWYMPAKNELEIVYFNLKSTTAANNTSSGINPNAVPARASNYTSDGAPTQTSAAIFQYPSGAEYMDRTGFQSSTEFSATQKWAQSWASGASGFQYGRNKVYSDIVRAVRRVAV